MWPSTPAHEEGAFTRSRDNAVHVPATPSLEYLTRWSVMLLVGADRQHDSRWRLRFCRRLQLGRNGGSVGLVRHRKCAERGIRSSQHLDVHSARCRFTLSTISCCAASSILMPFQDMVPILTQLGDLHAERFEPLGNALVCA